MIDDVVEFLDIAFRNIYSFAFVAIQIFLNAFYGVISVRYGLFSVVHSTGPV